MRIKDLYTYNKQLDSYDIEIAIEQYQDVFNTWDAAPLKRKDIEPDLMEYLEQAGFDIPLKKKVNIIFMMPKNVRDSKKEALTKEAFEMQFKYLISVKNKDINFNYRRMFTFFIASIILISSNFFLKDIASSAFVETLILEGMLIGGWFLLWNAFSIAVLDNYKLRKIRKIFSRYLKSSIVFRDQSA
jgi:hypothetical protein